MPNNDLNVPQGGRRVFPPHPHDPSMEFEELDDFLTSDRAPEDCMQLSDLDGFLTAVAIGPELIMPSEWLPVIWGEGEPEFESVEEAKGVIGAIMARYNEILHLIQHQPDDYEPLFWETPDGEAVAGDWAEGFMAGVALRRSAWQPLAGIRKRMAGSSRRSSRSSTMMTGTHSSKARPISSPRFRRPLWN